MSGIVIALLVLVIAAAVVVMVAKGYSRKNGRGQETEGTARVRDLKVDAVEMKRKKEPVTDAPEVTAAKKELYQ